MNNNIKTEKITLGDGKEYTIGEFNVGDFVQIEEKYGSLQLDSKKMGPMMFWFWLAIKKCHKDMTLEKLYELMPASFVNKGITDIFAVMSKLNGWTSEESKNDQSPVEIKK